VVDRVVTALSTTLQSALICLELFNQKGLPNHAAAGAYGFLFAAAPGLLFVGAILSQVLSLSPEEAGAMIRRIGGMGTVFDAEQMIGGFLASSRGGVAGLVSAVSLFWTARIFSQALQRGLMVVFPAEKKANALRGTLSALALEAFLIVLIIGFMLIAVSGSRSALPLSFALLWIFVFCSYLFVPLRAGKRRSALGPSLGGSLVGITCFLPVFALSRFIFNPEKYTALYGALGELFILLATVYFFFTFFFMGAELTFVIQHFDALLFSRFTRFFTVSGKKSINQRIFLAARSALGKYRRRYRAGEFLFYQGDTSREVYYVLRGQAGVHLNRFRDSPPGGTEPPVGVIREGKFFGEMSRLGSEGRSAAIQALTDLETFCLSPELFEEVLKEDPDTDSRVIESFSERLKNTNERLQKPPPEPRSSRPPPAPVDPPVEPVRSGRPMHL